MSIVWIIVLIIMFASEASAGWLLAIAILGLLFS